MPIYEYRCKKCDHKFEQLVARDPGKPLPCPSCSSEDTEKLLSVFGAMSARASAPSYCPSAGSCAAAGSSGCGGGMCGV